jgi:hypothetical protein
MNRSISLLAAVAFVVGGYSLVTSANAQAPMSDAAYCRALVNALDQGPGPHGILQPDNATAVAIAQCQEGNPGPAIPVLEQKLRDVKVQVPKRT